MKNISLPVQKELLEMFSYDPSTGDLYWKERKFKSALANGWNKRYANKKSGVENNEGYISVSINKKRYLAHRIIWKMNYGNEPMIIDHIDGNRKNNLLQNLRPATGALSLFNRKLKTGRLPRGVQPNKNGFMARLCTTYLGTYSTSSEASEAYKKAAMAKFNFVPQESNSDIGE